MDGSVVAQIVLGVFLTVAIAIMGLILKRISKEMDQKCNKETCEQKHFQVDKDLKRGEDQFGQLLSEMKDLNEGMNAANNTLGLLELRLDALDKGHLSRATDGG